METITLNTKPMEKSFIKLITCSIALSILMYPAFSSQAQTGKDPVRVAEELEEKGSYNHENGAEGNSDQPKDTIVHRSGQSDTTTIRIGGRTIRLIDKNGSTDVSVYDRDESRGTDRGRQSRPFRGNWSGLELGLNNYLNRDFSFSLDPTEDFMEVHAARSWNVNLNFLQYDLTLSDNNIGLVTGLGLELNNYRFGNNVNIAKQDRQIVPVTYDGVILERSRLRTYYLTVPLLLEFQSNHPRRSRRAYFSTGIIGGINIGSNTKIVYRDNSGKNRDKVRDDFYISPFRYGFTVRTGIRSLNLYANYYPTSLFQRNKGPELYPVAAGFSIIGF
jgi:hypothetical protein